MRSTAAFIMLLLLAPILATPTVKAADYTISTLIIKIDPDGYTNIEYNLTTDPTVANITLLLIGSGYTNLLITDQNQAPLNYQIKGEIASISTLGSDVNISYTTQSLTSKSGDLWEMNVTAPSSIDVLLPQSATLVSISQLPLEISTIDQRQSLVLPDGPNEVTYQLGIVGTKTHSLLVISDAESAINSAKASGLVVTSAEALLSKAKSDYNAGNYPSAEDYAGQTKNAVLTITAQASDANATIKSATNSIGKATSEGRTNGLDEAKSLLATAQASYKSGNYVKASATAMQAVKSADLATQPTNTVALILGAGAVIVVIATIIAVVTLRRRRREGPAVSNAEEVKGSVDLNSINKQFPDLRDEDKKVIEFIAESGGEAFADEIRKELGLPKTSTWRLIRRLLGLGIVGEKKVATKSLVYIEAIYRLKD